jgi:N-acetylglutamate synthase-like GNAT family acetyltransferase
MSELSAITTHYFSTSTRSHFWVATLNEDILENSSIPVSIHKDEGTNSVTGSREKIEGTLLATSPAESEFLSSKSYAKFDFLSPLSAISSVINVLTLNLTGSTCAEENMLRSSTETSIKLERASVVGTLACAQIDEGTCEFRFVSVHPEMQQSVLAGHMIIFGEAFARTKNYRRIIMYVHETRDELKQLLMKLQFRSMQYMDDTKYSSIVRLLNSAIFSHDVYEKILD